MTVVGLASKLVAGRWVVAGGHGLSQHGILAGRRTPQLAGRFFAPKGLGPLRPGLVAVRRASNLAGADPLLLHPRLQPVDASPSASTSKGLHACAAQRRCDGKSRR